MDNDAQSAGQPRLEVNHCKLLGAVQCGAAAHPGRFKLCATSLVYTHYGLVLDCEKRNTYHSFLYISIGQLKLVHLKLVCSF